MKRSELQKWAAILGVATAALALVVKAEAIARIVLEYQQRQPKGCEFRLESGDRTYSNARVDGEIRYSVRTGCPRIDPAHEDKIIDKGGDRPPTQAEGFIIDNYYEKGAVVDGERTYYIVGYHFSQNDTGLPRKSLISWLDSSKGRVTLLQNP